MAEAKDKDSRCSVILGPNGHNFIAWKSLMPFYLQGDPDVWKVVKGEIVAPTLNEGATEFTAEQKLQLAKFEKPNYKAKQLIFGSVHENIIVVLFYGQVQFISAKEMWDRINSNFSKNTTLRQNNIIAKFMEFTFAKNKSVEENLKRFNDL